MFIIENDCSFYQTNIVDVKGKKRSPAPVMANALHDAQIHPVIRVSLMKSVAYGEFMADLPEASENVLKALEEKKK